MGNPLRTLKNRSETRVGVGMGRDRDIKAIRADRAAQLLDQGEQLSMFGTGGATIPAEERPAKGPGGRPPGAQNKVKRKLGEYMAAKGYRDPAEQLALMAGLDRRDLHPWAYAASIAASLGEDTADVLKVMRQAAADVMPYWHAKLTPDVAVQVPTMQVAMVVPQGGDPAMGRLFGPPPMPDVEDQESEQDQGDSDGDDPEGAV